MTTDRNIATNTELAELCNLSAANQLPDTFTVLLVDDEENVLNSLKRVMRHEKYKIISANSGPEGLTLLKQSSVQMIISDQRMPEMTGLEFLERSRNICPDTIRVMLTGFSDLKTAEEAINKVEIYRFLSKPWNDDDLKATVRQGLEKWRLEQENTSLFRIIEQQNQELKQWNENLELTVVERTRDLKDAQAQLIQSEKMASLGILAGGVAHEINNPLGGILGITQLLLMKNPKDDLLLKDLKTIEEATLHCSEIVKNLLGFSRKNDASNREPVKIRRLVDNVLLMIGHLFEYGNIEVIKNIAEDFPVILANSNQIQQVLMNLLINAQQSMKHGGEVSIRGMVGDDGDVIVEIVDQGEGIKNSDLDKIFDPFFSTKQEGEGTGLGLSVSFRIIEEHGGCIKVNSKEGQGTIVSLVFPKDTVQKTEEHLLPENRFGFPTTKPELNN